MPTPTMPQPEETSRARKGDVRVEVIAKMIELTQQGRVKWRALDQAKTTENANRTSAVLETEYAGKRLRIFQTEEDRELTGFEAAIGMEAILGRRRRVITKTHLEVVNQEGHTVFAFPHVTPLDDLLAAAQYQIAGVDEFFKEILAQSDDIALKP